MRHYLTQPLPRDMHATAAYMSRSTQRPWFVMTRKGCDDIVVSYADHQEMMRRGWKIDCVFYNGFQYANAYWNRDKRRFDLTEVPSK